MPKGQSEFDDDAFDENGVLKDGRRIRVPLMMRDGVSDVHASRKTPWPAGSDCAVSDLHAPGPRYCTDRAALDAKEAIAMAAGMCARGATRSRRSRTPSPVEMEDVRPAIPVTDADFARLRQIGTKVIARWSPRWRARGGSRRDEP